MDSKEFGNRGKNICNEMTNRNPGDYLTSKVTAEASGIASEISGISGEISGVASAVAAERARLAELDRLAKEAEEE